MGGISAAPSKIMKFPDSLFIYLFYFINSMKVDHMVSRKSVLKIRWQRLCQNHA